MPGRNGNSSSSTKNPENDSWSDSQHDEEDSESESAEDDEEQWDCDAYLEGNAAGKMS